MEPECSWSRLQQPAICSYPDPDESNLCSLSLFQVTCFSSGLPSKFLHIYIYIYTYLLSHICDMHRPSHSHWFDYPTHILFRYAYVCYLLQFEVSDKIDKVLFELYVN